METSTKILHALYVGSGKFKTSARVARELNLTENEVRAELSDLIGAGVVVQLHVDGEYIYAHKKALVR